MKNPKKTIHLFASLLVLGACYKLIGFLDYPYYKFMFQNLPEELIARRYAGSILLRTISLVVAAGLFAKKEWARKAVLVLAVSGLATLYWKHPFTVFYYIAVWLENGGGEYVRIPPGSALQYPYFPWISLMFHSVIDIIFHAAILYYFTRKEIKNMFTKSARWPLARL